MKKFVLFIVLILAFIQESTAQPKPQDTNLVWIDKYQISLANLNNIQIAPDGKRVFVSSNDQTSNIRIIDFETGVFLDSIMAKGLLAGFSKDNKYIYTYTGNNILKLDADTYQEVAHLDSTLDSKDLFDFVTIMPNGNLAASLYNGSYLFYIIDGEFLKILKSIPQYTDSTNGEPSTGMGNFCISQDESIMAAIQYFAVPYPPNNIGKLNLWDLNTFKVIKNIPTLDQYPFFDIITDMAFLPNTNFLILSVGNELRFYDYQKVIRGQTFSPITENFILLNDNKRIYFGSTGGVRIVDLNNYQDICTTITPDSFGAGYFDLSKDEKSIINAQPWTLMELKNCLNDVGVNEYKISSDTLIIPNPVKDNINIKLSSNLNGIFSYSIFALNGLNLKNGNISILNGIGQINIPDLLNGTYFLNLKKEKNNFVFKLMVGR